MPPAGAARTRRCRGGTIGLGWHVTDGRLWWKDIGLLMDYVWQWMPAPKQEPPGAAGGKAGGGRQADPQADSRAVVDRSARAGGTLTMEPQHFAGCGTSGRLHGGEGGSDVDAPWATATLYGGASRS